MKTSPKTATVKPTKKPAPPRPLEEARPRVPQVNGRPVKAMNLERREALHHMLMGRRQQIMKEIGSVLGQSLTEDQQRRLESSRDVGDQALIDLQRELGISLLEMRNRKRQLMDEALARLAEGTYGYCAECGIEISERRLAAVPFAKLCVECQTKQELMEKFEKAEERG